MGRREGPLERDGSAVRDFAFGLRDLRNRAGLTYQQLARVTNYGISTLQAAAAGQTLPTQKVTVAFVVACGGDREAWRDYWVEVKRALDPDSPRDRARLLEPPEPSRPAMPEAADQPAPAGAEAPDGWYVESFSALLRLDVPQPEAVEHRVIVAAEDGLDELATSISVPRHPDDRAGAHWLETEVEFGGVLALREQPYESYFRNVLTLSRALNTGERHEYQLRLRLPPGQQLAPHYVYVPLCRSDRFELRVRFSPDRLPKAVWVLPGTPTAVIYERNPNGTNLTPDRAGEVRAEFRDLKIGLGYGVSWLE